MKISIVVAVAENGVIGKENRLLWRLSNDLKRFKEITTGHHMLMGRKTFESIGKALPNRTTLIISRDTSLYYPDCHMFSTIDDAIEFARTNGEAELFIVGGGEIYRQTLTLADTIHLTVVHTEIDGDTHFDYDDSAWEVVHREFVPADERNEFDSTYLLLERR